MTEVASTTAQRRLGRGLTALLGGNGPAPVETDRTVASEMREIPIASITRNPYQPRQQFDAEALGELAGSIKEHGVLQPLLVREVDNGFQLVAGERRWQAAQKAGLTTIPCRVVDVIDKTACEFALEENLKRKDLNDLEKAQAFREYLNNFECTMEELAKQLSMNRSTISNMLRLLELPDSIKLALHAGRVSAGHARALLPLEAADQLELCGRIQSEHLSVRKTEAIVKEKLGRVPAPAPEATAAPAVASPTDGTTPQQTEEPTAQSETTASESPVADDSFSEATPDSAPNSEAADAPETLPMAVPDEGRTNHILSLEEQLRDLLGVPVQIKLRSKESGQIVIPFNTNDEFERILRTVRRAAA